MRIYEKKEDCYGCGACMDACQRGAIQMRSDKEGFLYPHVKKKLCIQCRRCEQVCPIRNREGKGRYEERRYFGAKARDSRVRHTSTSGGIFTAAAKRMLENGGAVYGAGYDQDMKVVHKEVLKIEDLEDIRRTKYVQSDLSGTYRQIEQRLKEGLPVLFCGTPCQAQGLRLFLRQEYEKLLIMDIICYGVPSPGIWEAYVRYLEQKKGGKMTAFSFRDKRNQDDGHTRSYVIREKEYADSMYRDIYCQMYFKNYMLRPSCHSCKFCATARDSDVTIGDFWGIEKIKPEWADGMGQSVVILHTKKAKRWWQAIRKELDYFECEREDILQPRLTCPTDMAGERRKFMRLYRISPPLLFQYFERKI